MRIRTLVILAIVMMFLGSGLGAGYAFMSGQESPALGLPQIIPTQESIEENMISDFIEQQEEMHPDGMNEIEISSYNDKYSSGSSKDNKNEKNDNKDNKDKEPAAEQPAETPADEPEDDGSWINLGKGEQVGQPTVRDGVALNVRSGPSQDDQVMAKVYNHDKIILLSQVDGWYRVVTRNGVEGYVSGEYVKIVK